MQSYVLSMSGSGATSEIFAESDSAAMAAAELTLGSDVVWADQWDADGHNDEGAPCKRILAWDSEDAAHGDAGERAIAQLSTVGTVGGER